MDENTENQLTQPHQQWLERSEKKIFKVFEALQDVYVEIIEGSFKFQKPNGVNICPNCKKENIVLDSEFDKWANQKERHTSKFKAELDLWKEKYLRLKRKYKLLKKEVSPVKKPSGERNGISGSEISHLETKSIVEEAAGTATNCKTDAQDKESRTELTNCENDEDVVCLAANTDNGLYRINGNDFAVKVDAISSERKHQDVIDITEVECSDQESMTDGDVSKREQEDDDLSWKRANRDLKQINRDLRSKPSVKVKYKDGSRTSSSSSINDFFKPKSTVPIRKISSKRSKRQISDASIESPKINRRKGMKFDDGSEERLVLKESVTEDQESSYEGEDLKKACKKDHHEHTDIKKLKDGSLRIAETSESQSKEYRSPARKSKASSCKSLTAAFNETETVNGKSGAQQNVLKPAVSPQKRKSVLVGRKSNDTTDMDATKWEFEENLGYPNLASTPMIRYDNGPKISANGSDVDDTMWSAPDSPSVVRSMFSSPEKPNSKSHSSLSKETEMPAVSPTKKVTNILGKRQIPVLLKESPAYMKDATGDSKFKSRLGDYTCKTSDADLSCDMFHGSPDEHTSMKVDLVHEEDVPEIQSSFQKESIIEEEEKPVKEQVKGKVHVNYDDNDSFSFQKNNRPNVNYKYEMVVRKRNERDKMQGFECRECAAWYKDEPDFEEKRKHLKLICRHKAVSSPPPASPDGFWSVGFPDTQEYMRKGHMFHENQPLPLHAMPKDRQEKLEKITTRKKLQNDG